MIILSGDIGGTKTLLRLAECGDSGRCTEIARQRFSSAQYANFDSIVAEFLTNHQDKRVSSACFGVAGPVTLNAEGYSSKITNLPWQIASAPLQRTFSIPNVSLINDFQSVGFGIEVLNDSDIEILQTGSASNNANQLVVGAGTGLGVAQRIQSPTLQVIGTEGGHANFAPSTAQQIDLAMFVSELYGRCSIEHIVSGPGLLNIFKFICDRANQNGSTTYQSIIDAADPPAMISSTADQGDALCNSTLDLFVECYGSQVGNLALSTLPRGGVYIAGGIAPKIIERLQSGGFMDAFVDKGSMRTLLESIPVKVVMNPEVGLLGSEFFATLQNQER